MVWRSPYLPCLLVGVDFLQQHKKNSFLRLTWEDAISREALFLWNQTAECQRFHFPQPNQEKIPISPLAGLKSETLSRICSPWLHSPIQYQASLICVSLLQSIRPLHVGSAGPHGYGGNTGKGKEAKSKPGAQRERELLCSGDYVFPIFQTLAVAPSSLANDLSSQV